MTLNEPRCVVVVPFRIDRRRAKDKTGRSLEARRLERLQRAQEMLEVMEEQGVRYFSKSQGKDA